MPPIKNLKKKKKNNNNLALIKKTDNPFAARPFLFFCSSKQFDHSEQLF